MDEEGPAEKVPWGDSAGRGSETYGVTFSRFREIKGTAGAN